MRKLLLICSAVALFYGNCVWGMDYNEEELYENPWNEPNLDLKKEDEQHNELYENPWKDVSSKSQNKLTEEKIEKLQQKLKKVKLEEETQKPDGNLIFKSKQTDHSKPKGFNFKNFDIQHPETLFNIGSSTESRKISQSKRKIQKKAKNNEKYQKSPQEQLFEAIQNGNLADVSDAIKNGADVNIENNFGDTPLRNAFLTKNLKIVKFLVEHGADINQTDNDGSTLLHVASLNGYLVVRFLVKHGANINQSDKNGHTPLHVAAQNGHLETVDYLVEHGADINKTNKDGKTPLDIAKIYAHQEIVDYLKSKGAK